MYVFLVVFQGAEFKFNCFEAYENARLVHFHASKLLNLSSAPWKTTKKTCKSSF